MDDERGRGTERDTKGSDQPVEGRCIRRPGWRSIVVGELSAGRGQEQNANRRLRRSNEVSQHAGLLPSGVASGGHERVLERNWSDTDASVTGQCRHVRSVSLFFSF